MIGFERVEDKYDLFYTTLNMFATFRKFAKDLNHQAKILEDSRKMWLEIKTKLGEAGVESKYVAAEIEEIDHALERYYQLLSEPIPYLNVS